jgi:hypothetical protein
MGVVGIVGDQDHGDAPFGGLADLGENEIGLPDTQSGGRFVEDEDPGPEVKGTGDGQDLSLPT